MTRNDSFTADLACPKCKTELKEAQDKESLYCENCSGKYEIKNGIHVFK